MKKKISLIAALLALVFIFGCAGELVFVKDAKLYRVKDDGDDRQQIIPDPPLPTPNYGLYHRPDVNHNGDKVAFIEGSSASPFGTLWTMKLDGSSTKQINLPGSDSFVARWYPDNEQYIAYFGKDTNGQYGICRVRTDQPPANGQRICDTNSRDNLGFDINKPQTGPRQIIFARRESNNKPKLYWRKVETDPAACLTSDPSKINPFPIPRPGVTDPNQLLAEIEESLPVVSFSQEMLASAVEWPNFIGIRIRGIGQDGSIGPPATFKLEGFKEITGVSFADEDQKIYLSAEMTTGEHRLYYIGLEEILRGLADLVNLTAAEIIQPRPVNPQRIHVGDGNIFWPSGINTP